jgi:hypothetical protein
MTTIEGIVVNHNTSLFTELCLRSLLATHTHLDLAMTICDNASTDDSASLRAYAEAHQIPFLASGFGLDAGNNTHGEVLRAFILEHPDPLYYLLLDADICFLQPDTLLTIQRELDADPYLFAVQGRMTVNGIDELPGSGWHINMNKPISLKASLDSQPEKEVWGLLQPRCHPGCVLIKNTPAFRRVAEHIGLSTAWLYGEAQPNRGFYDTFGLACLVMKTHGQSYGLSSALVQHFFSVSYNDEAMDWKRRVAEEKVAVLRG